MERNAIIKHWEVIVAYKNGGKVEILSELNIWVRCLSPEFHQYREYRVMKEPIELVSGQFYVIKYAGYEDFNHRVGREGMSSEKFLGKHKVQYVGEVITESSGWRKVFYKKDDSTYWMFTNQNTDYVEKVCSD